MNPVNILRSLNFTSLTPNLNGNVAEFIAEGFANGGCWKSAGFDVRNESSIKTNGPSTGIGFRPVFSVREK